MGAHVCVCMCMLVTKDSVQGLQRGLRKRGWGTPQPFQEVATVTFSPYSSEASSVLLSSCHLHGWRVRTKAGTPAVSCVVQARWTCGFSHTKTSLGDRLACSVPEAGKCVNLFFSLHLRAVCLNIQRSPAERTPGVLPAGQH